MNDDMIGSGPDRRSFLVGGVTLGMTAASAKTAFAAGSAPLRIALIGAGREGGAIGALFAKAGHPVFFSSRHPEQLADLVAAAGPNARSGSVAEAVAFGDVVVIALPFTALEQLGKDFGGQLAAKRLVIDASNAIGFRDGEALVRWVDDQGGAGLATAKLIPGVRLVRGFNTLRYERLQHDADTGVGLPIAGDDPAAVALATRLIKETGLEPVLIGGLSKGRYLVIKSPLFDEHPPAELRRIAAGLT